MDILKQINYWRVGAAEELSAAESLLRSGLYSQSLFHAHLALEKILKAHVCGKTQKVPPFIHNLVRLSEFAELTIPDLFIDTLAEMNQYNLAGRYPESLPGNITLEECRTKLKQSEEALTWLTAELLKA